MSAADMPRVFLGFHDIALYQSKLKEGLQKLGCRVTRIAWRDDLKFGEDDSRRAWPFRLLRPIRRWSDEAWRRVDRTPKTDLFRLCVRVMAARLLGLAMKLLQWASLLWVVAKHDVVILSYNDSFLEWDDHTMCSVNRCGRDLRLIKACGRKLVFTFHGSDSRPPYLDGYVMRNPRRLTPKDRVELTRSRQRLIRMIERYADVCVSVPAQTYFHTQPIVLHEYLGRPFEGVDIPDAHGEKKRPVVLHAPSNPHAKGTDGLRAAMEALRRDGYDFEFVEIVRRPHGELMQALRQADLVVDQLYSDRVITGVATEAMYFGVPVVLGGYYADYYHRDYDGHVPIPPLIFCRPEDIVSKVAELLQNEDRRKELGRAGREYVRTYFTPLRVAERWLALIEGRLPPEAYYNPADLRYPYGCGLSLDQLRESIALMLREGGKEALCLSDKPTLEAAVVALTDGEKT